MTKPMEKKKIFWSILALMVILGGGFYLRAKSSQLPVFGPTATPPPATSFPPPDWKMYSSDSFSYSLFYPPEWTPREQGRVNDRTLDVTSFTVVFEGEKIPLIQVKVSSLPYQEEISKRDIETSGFSSESKKGAKIVIGEIEGVRAVSKVDDQKETISVFLPGKDKTFILLGWPEVLPGQNKTDLIDQVFSTFKITP